MGPGITNYRINFRGVLAITRLILVIITCKRNIIPNGSTLERKKVSGVQCLSPQGFNRFFNHLSINSLMRTSPINHLDFNYIR